MIKKEKNKLDKIWREIVQSRGACEYCGTKSGQLHAHHIRSRRFLNTRWDLDNAILLCATHHFFAHQQGIFFDNWLIETRGEEWFRQLKRRSDEIIKPKFEIIHSQLKNNLANKN